MPDTDKKSAPTGLVGFRVINRSPENITLWLGSPIAYVLNVSAGSEAAFTVERAVYSYQIAACGIQASGFMDLTTHSYYLQPECQTELLVRVYVQNEEPENLAVMMQGVQDYVIPVGAGQTRTVTIARGAYDVEVVGCDRPVSINFAARSERTLSLTCP